MLNYNDKFFTFNRWLLRFGGLWAPQTKFKILKLAYRLYSIFILIFVIIFYTYAEFASVFYTYGELYPFTKNINFFLTHFMGAVKVIFWYFKGGVLRNLMDVLESPEFVYENCGRFRPKEIIEKYKKIGFRYSFGFYFMAHTVVLLSYLPPAITVILRPPYYDVTTGNSSEFYRMLPYYSWMPFVHNSPKSYLLALGYQFVPTYVYLYIIVGMDTLFMNLMNFITGHFAVLQVAFMTIAQRADISDDLKGEMKKNFRHLQTILRVCENLENVHKYVTLGQATATLFILCTSLFLVSATPPGSKQFLTEVVYMLAMGYQLYLYCWFGNDLTFTAGEIPMYIWKSSWFEISDSRVRKDLIFTMARMKKPIYLTVGKFAPLTLPTFTSIIKTSYSAFAVIKNTE